MSKRVWKLQDFVAHAGNVNCARLGEKSGQVLATGGEDKRVNIWKVGKPNAMMSLTGHNSSVECLVFDKQEEVLVVGCGGGSMQVWNLEYRKMAGTLTGHRTACASVEFHPYGEFFASGSVDTNLKIWDLRRKSCIQTYKGHTGSITSIRFSPHGRWVATGGQDSQVKLWDLTAGKLMRDLDLHKGPITSVAFHPKEYLLATGSADRTTKLWSLESFRAVGSTELGSSTVQAVKFYVEEQAVLSASHDALRSYAADALSAPLDTLEVDWRGLQDLRLCFPEEKLIAITTDGPQLGIWVADLQRREAGSAKSAGGGYGRLHSRAGPTNHTKLQTQVARRAPDDVELGDHQGLDCSEEPMAEPMAAVPERAVPGLAERAPLDRGLRARVAAVPPERTPERTTAAAERPAPRGAARPASPGAAPEAAGEARASCSQEPSITGAPARAVASTCGSTDAAPAASQRSRRPNVDNSLEHALRISAQHQQMMGVLQRRLDQVHRLKELWASGNFAGLHSIVNVPQDHAVFCDFARAVMRQRLEPALNLDACQMLLPILQDLLRSKYDDFVTIALEFVEVLLQHFGDLIAETRLSCAKIPERQLDLAREERLEKCDACYGHFQEILRQLPDPHPGSRSGGTRASLQAFLQRC